MKSNKDLVSYLIARGVLKSKWIVRAMLSEDRRNFVLPQYRKYAYVDDALPHLGGQTISQPSVVVFMLELLDVNETSKVVEVGSGSGYVLALLSHRAKRVFGFEVKEKLFKFALPRLWHRKNVTNILYNPVGGLEGLHFDRLLISAEARNWPEALINSLSNGGIAVFPYQGSIYKVRHTEEGNDVLGVFPGFAFVPLVEV